MRTEPFGLVPEEVRAALPEDVEDAYPLSALQAGMLFHSALEPGTGIYHDIKSYAIELCFRAEVLESSLKELSARHEVLRTSIEEGRYGEPLQLVHREVRLPVVVEELGGLAEAEQQRRLGAFVEEESRRAFDWGVAPLFRVFVHVLGEGAFQVSFSFHHAMVDGWSMASLLTELIGRYAAGLRGEPVESPPMEATFADFVAMERRAAGFREGPPLLGAAARWPFGGGVAAVGETVRGRGSGGCVVPIGRNESDGLKAFAAQAGVSVKSALLAVHLKALSVLTGREDVTTGVVFNGRPETSGGESLVGLFLNTLPFRMRLGGESWRELMVCGVPAGAGHGAPPPFPHAGDQAAHGGPGTLRVDVQLHALPRVPEAGSPRRT